MFARFHTLNTFCAYSKIGLKNLIFFSISFLGLNRFYFCFNRFEKRNKNYFTLDVSIRPHRRRKLHVSFPTKEYTILLWDYVVFSKEKVIKTASDAAHQNIYLLCSCFFEILWDASVGTSLHLKRVSVFSQTFNVIKLKVSKWISRVVW